MAESILSELKSQYQYLTKVEKKIADLVFEDPEKFTTYTTAKVAKLCDVSQGSINNFARKFDERGFSFFKLEVARCVSYQYNLNKQEPKSQPSGVLGAMERKIREDISALCNTLEINDEATLARVIDKILEANKIEVYGIFQSGIVAKNMAFKLVELGIPAAYQGDSLMFEVSSSMLSEKDLVIAISASGTTKDVYDAAEIAKKSGASVVAITANKFSPLAKISDDVVLTTSGHGSNVDRTEKMRMSQLLIVDTLCYYIKQIFKKNGRYTNDRLEKILSSRSISNN